MSQRKLPSNKARRRQRGAISLEYIVLGVVLVLGLIVGIAFLRDRIITALGNVGDNVERVTADEVVVPPPVQPGQ